MLSMPSDPKFDAHPIWSEGNSPLSNGVVPAREWPSMCRRRYKGTKETDVMNRIIYVIGLIVVVLFIAGYLGIR